MDDIAPGLLEAVQKEFSDRVAGNPNIKSISQQIADGTAAYAEAQEYAYLVGEALSQAFGNVLVPGALPDGRMYYNIADRVIRPMLEDDHKLISDAALAVQKALNEKAGIGIKPQPAPLNADRIDGIINKVAEAEAFSDAAWVLEEPVINYSQNVVDETIRANVDFQGKAGLSPRIIRKAERGACKWCRNLAGIFTYPAIHEDVYRRHQRCRCVVEYDPDGNGKRQNVHTKQWTTPEDRAILEARKYIGLDGGYALTAQERLSKKKLKNGFSAFPDGDVLNRYITRVKPKEGFYDVAMHGTSTMVCFGSQSTNMTARQLATYLRHQDGYHGGAIRLLSCNTGKKINGGYCFAEELANALGVEVEAPNKKLYIYENGALSVGAAGDGSFILYRPNERRRLT